MAEHNSPIHISELCKRVWEDHERQEARLDAMSSDERADWAEAQGTKPDLLDQVAKMLSERTGLTTEDVLVYIHRAGHDMHWGRWKRRGHGDEWPDISKIAEELANFDLHGGTAPLIEIIWAEYPQEAAQMGLPEAPTAEPATIGPRAHLSCDDLSKIHGLSEVQKERLRKRLGRYRERHHDGWIEVTDRRPRQPRYLYQPEAIGDIIEAVKTSGQRPARK